MRRAVFYILSGKDYIDLARLSAASLEQHMPDVPRFLFTPDENVDKGQAFHEIFSLPKRESSLWYLDCTLYLSHALNILYAQGIYELVYLDSDTFAVEPFYELFDMLEYFNLLAAHAPGRKTCPTVHPIPDCFPELNIGVMGLQNSSRTRNLVYNWYEKYWRYQEIYGNNDQGSLRETLWQHEYCSGFSFSFYILPPEYNCRPLEAGVFLNGKARILHMRSPKLLELAETVNAKTGMRIWKP